MKKVIILVLTLGLISCAPGEPFGPKCKTESHLLKNLRVGDTIKSNELVDLFNTAQDHSTYISGSFCRETYIFNQYNDIDHNWCYYYSIGIDCDTRIVTKIFKN